MMKRDGRALLLGEEAEAVKKKKTEGANFDHKAKINNRKIRDGGEMREVKHVPVYRPLF